MHSATEITSHLILHPSHLLSLLVSVLLCNTWTDFLLFVRFFFVLFFHFLLLLLLRWWWGCILLSNLLCHQLRVYSRFSIITRKREIYSQFYTVKITTLRALWRLISATREEHSTLKEPNRCPYLMWSTTAVTKQDRNVKRNTLNCCFTRF